jgi:hypothetical protein
MVEKGVKRKKMGAALAMFQTRCKNHERVLTSYQYEIIRKEYSKSSKGVMPPQSVMEAAWASRRGVGLTDEQKEKLSKALKRPISCYLINPNNEIIFTTNLKQFCEENGLKWNYMRSLYGKKKDNRMIVGKNKGWGIFFGQVRELRDLSEIKRNSATKGWESRKK